METETKFNNENTNNNTTSNNETTNKIHVPLPPKSHPLLKKAVLRESQFPSFKSPRCSPLLKCQSNNVRKCILLGDEGVGKTSLVHRFLFDEFKPPYPPTVREDYTFSSQQGGGVDLEILDVGGEPYLDRLRPLCYEKGTEVAIICYSVVKPTSFVNVGKRWLPELKRHCLNKNNNENVKTVLVGTQSDLRSNLSILLKLMEDGQSPVSELRGIRLAKKIGAVAYLEVSSMSGFNVKKVFDTALNPEGIISISSSTTPKKDVNNLMRRKKSTTGSSRNSSPNRGNYSSDKVDRENKPNYHHPIPYPDRSKLWKKWISKQNKISFSSTKIKRLMLVCH